MNPLMFCVTHKFDVTLNQKLQSLCFWHKWDSYNEYYIYIFPMKVLQQVIELTGQIQINNDDLEILNHHQHNNSKEITIDQWKGKSGFEVIETINEFVIVEYQKDFKDAPPKRNEHRVPKERVVKIWTDIIQPLEFGESYEFKYLASKVCKLFELDRFFRDSGSFDEQKFQGTRCPHEYGQFYYYPIKVLQYYGLIDHKGRFVTRIANMWDEQAVLREVQ